MSRVKNEYCISPKLVSDQTDQSKDPYVREVRIGVVGVDAIYGVRIKPLISVTSKTRPVETPMIQWDYEETQV